MAPADLPDCLPNIYSSSHKIDSCPRTLPFFVFSVLFFFPLFYSTCLFCFIFLSSFSFPFLYCFIISAFPFFLPYLFSFFRLSILFFCLCLLLFRFRYFFVFLNIFLPIFTSFLFLCHVTASPEICVCPVNVIPIIIGVTGSHFSYIPDTEALSDAVPYVCMR